MYDVISIGGATQDVFVRSEGAQVISVANPRQKKAWLGFDYGSKINVESIKFTIGGGATNSAVSMAKWGLKTACLVKVGADKAGEQVCQELQQSGVDTSLVVKGGGDTGYSVILTSFEGERSILAYRGENRNLQAEDLNWDALKKTRWFYLTSLSGGSDQQLEAVLSFAQKEGISVAWNPGGTQIKSGYERLKPLLASVDLLFMNRDEASALTGIFPERPLPEHLRASDAERSLPGFMYDMSELLSELKKHVKGTVVLTDGKRGTQIYDGKQAFAMPVYPVDIKDVLGAGDAFGSAFTATWIQFGSLEQALKLAAANGASVVTDPGAHFGLLTLAQAQTWQDKHPHIQVIPFSI